MIDQVVELLELNPDCVISTLACEITDSVEIEDPNTVKVVLDKDGCALYFSRWPIPYVREHGGVPAKGAGRDIVQLKHVGIYGYGRDFLATFSSLPQSPSEKAEKLEQLRALHHGYRIAVGITPYNTLGIDTPEDFDAFAARNAARGEDSKIEEQ